MAKVHWLWPAYAQLCQDLKVPADEAIEQLQALWPSLPVRAIIRAEGNVNVTLADVMAADELDRQTSQQQQQGSGTQGQQQNGQQGSGSEGQGDELTFNDRIRGRASRGAKTVELSHDQIMGVDTAKQDGEQGAEPDFIRAAIDRKRAG